LGRVIDVQTGKMIGAAIGAIGVWATDLEILFKTGASALLFGYMALRFVRELTKKRLNCEDCALRLAAGRGRPDLGPGPDNAS
jgi:hypothetical protein